MHSGSTGPAGMGGFAPEQLAAQWQQFLQGVSSSAGTGVPGMAALQFDPARLQQLQSDYLQGMSSLWGGQESGGAKPDRRFAGEAWERNPMAGFAARAHLLNTRILAGLAEAVEADEKTKARIRFAVEQWAAAAAPSNFLAFNADAQQKAIETQGQSIAQGLQTLAADRRRGHVSPTDETVFEVGRNVATT